MYDYFQKHFEKWEFKNIIFNYDKSKTTFLLGLKGYNNNNQRYHNEMKDI